MKPFIAIFIVITLYVINSFKSFDVSIIKNENKTASDTALAIISTLKNIKQYVKSITVDQGGEFNKYPWIKECIGDDFYFCEPSSPYQKAAIENGLPLTVNHRGQNRDLGLRQNLRLSSTA